MEPEKNRPDDAIDKETLSNLKDEGVEVEASSQRAEENEFSSELSASQNPLGGIDQKLDSETKAILAEISEPIKKTIPPPEPKTAQTVAPVVPTQSTTPENKVASISRPTPSANDPSIHQLRTFKMDAEEAVRYNNISASDIAIAEQKKREATPIEYNNGEKSMLPLILSVTLVLLLALGAGGYFYLRGQSVTTVPKQTSSIRSIISYNKSVTISSPSSDMILTQVVASAKDISGNVGDVIFIAVPDSGTTTRQVSLARALAGTKAPEKLVRSLKDDYMFGVHIFDGPAPFVILKTSFFQNAFPGMLEWEKDMRNGLLPLIRLGRPNIEAISTNTDIFRDRIIANKDVRELIDANGAPILLYTFADKDIILITTNEKSLRELLDKILTVRVIQ